MGYVYINFSNLNEESQNELMEVAKSRIDKEELEKECEENWWNFEQVLNERAEKELYNLDIVFNI